MNKIKYVELLDKVSKQSGNMSMKMANEKAKELCLSCHSKEVAVKGELWCNACFNKMLTAQ